MLPCGAHFQKPGFEPGFCFLEIADMARIVRHSTANPPCSSKRADGADDAHPNLMRFNELSAKASPAAGEAARNRRSVLNTGKFFVSFHSRNDYFSYLRSDLVMAPNQLLKLVKIEN